MRQPSRRIHKPFQSRSGLARQHLDEERLLDPGLGSSMFPARVVGERAFL